MTPVLPSAYLPVYPVPPLAPRTSTARWLATMAAVVLLHLLAMMWAGERMVTPAPVHETIISAYLPQQAARVVAVTPKTAPPVRPLRPAHKPRPPAPAVTEAVAAPPAPEPAAAADPAPPAIAATEAAPTPAPPEPAPAAPPPPPAFRFSLPPPALMKYDVQKISADGQNIYGSGSISWRTDGHRYAIAGEAGILFITALSFNSSGEVDEGGIAPELYTEKRFRKSATNTHFNRARNRISFSSSEQSYPRQGGEQDRASIVWQLAGIARGDSDKIVAGAHIDLFVAGIRDGEIWPIQVLGQEDIELGSGRTAAWHLVRVPKPGSFDQKIDIWLAPTEDWTPVRLRQTDANGDYLEMTMKSRQTPSPL